MAKAGTPTSGGVSFGFGVNWCQLGWEGIKRAVEKVGAENVTGMDVYDAFRTIKDFYVSSASRSPYDFTEDTVGQHYVSIYEVQDGEVVRIADKVFCPNLW